MKFIRRFWPEIKIVGTVFIIWRAWLFAVSFLAEKILTFKESFPYVGRLSSSGLPGFIWSWGNFDGVHYLQIAQHGYTELGLQVFFPFYPILITCTNLLINNWVLSGVIVSNLFIFLAAIVLYKLTERQFNNQIALWSVLFLFFSPLSLYFGAIYTESFFIFLLLASFYFSGIVGAIFGGLASGVRLVGSFIFPAMLIEDAKRRWAILVLFGIGTYMGYLWLQFHNPIIFLSGQSAFSNSRADSLTSLVLPPQVVYRYIKIFFTASILHYDFWIAILEFAFYIFGLIVLTITTFKRKLQLSWLIFSWSAILLPSFSGTLSSMPRYLLVIFPIYISLALIRSIRIRVGILAFFIILLSLFTVLFTRGYWIS